MTKSQNITIGGLFSIFHNSTSNYIDQEQLESLHAFIAAIDEINNRTDILPDHRVLYVIRTPYPDSFSSILYSTQDLVNNNVKGIVGSLNNYGTDVSNRLLNEYNIVQSFSLASGAQFSVGEDYPYKVQTAPNEEYQGLVLQNYLCNTLSINRIAIVVSNDFYGRIFTVVMSLPLFCQIQLVHTLYVRSNQEDFTDYTNSVKHLGITAFVFAVSPKHAAMLLEQGYNRGLFHQGVQVFTDSGTIQPEIFDYFTTTADIKEILSGLVSLEFWKNHFLYTDEGMTFVSLWLNQTETISTCSSLVDVSGVNYLMKPSGVGCAGLDFSSYFKNGSNIYPTTAYTYDATGLLLRGIHDVLYNQVDTTLTGDNIHFSLINNTNFMGATGVINIYEGVELDGITAYGMGNTEAGFTHTVLNFNTEVYELNLDGDKSNAFVRVGEFSEEEGFTVSCDEIHNCTYPLTFNTKGNTFPESLPPYASKTLPKVLKLGGLFYPFDSSGNMNLAQVEDMHAFLMAVNHLNNKTDGLWDDCLPDTDIVVMINGDGGDSLGGATGITQLIQGFYNTSVDGVVGALDNTATSAADKVANSYGLVQVHSVADNSEFGRADLYQYKAQTQPVTAFQSIMIQYLLCYHFKVSKIAVFALYDFFGLTASNGVANCAFCCIDVLGDTIFITDPKTLDFSAELQLAKDRGALYYIFFLPSLTTAHLIEQGFANNVFTEGMQFIGITEHVSEDFIKMFQDETKVGNYLKGFIAVEHYDDFTFNLDSGQLFLQKWREQASTTAVEINGQIQCRLDKDDESNFFLYRSQANMSQCSGLNYSSYNSLDGSDFTSTHILQTYDATVAIAKGFDYLLKNNITDISGDLLLDTLFEKVVFSGMSGYVGFYRGYLDVYDRGNRVIGNYYKVWNFQKDTSNTFDSIRTTSSSSSSSNDYNGNNTTTKKYGFVPASVLSFETGILPFCPDSLVCKPIIYSTAHNGMVKDTSDDIIISMNPGVVITFEVFSSIAAVFIAFFFFILFCFRRSCLLKASQMPMLFIILLGECLGVVKVLIATKPINDATCIAGLWFAHLGFFMVFGALLLKSWRVHRLLNTKSLKRVKISTEYVLKLLLGLIGCVILYMIAFTLVGEPHLAYQSSTSSNQTTRYPFCAFVHPEFETALFAIEFCLLCYGVKVCWDIKNVPDAINESQYIAAAMALIAILTYMLFPILISSPPRLTEIIACTGFLVGIFATTLIIFTPKTQILMTGRDLMKDMTIGYTATGSKVKPTTNHPPVAENGHSGKGNLGDGHLVGISSNQLKNTNNFDIEKGGKEQINLSHKTVPSPASSSNTTSPFVALSSSSSSSFGMPRLSEVPGNKYKKLDAINLHLAHWHKLKMQIDQLLLNQGDQSGASSQSGMNAMDSSKDSVTNSDSKKNDGKIQTRDAVLVRRDSI